ncbi:hypothetical protein [Tolypothrix sp. PCC 7910]|nr:hypothetical protein [Tolypothrix sp. PCC 7910]
MENRGWGQGDKFPLPITNYPLPHDKYQPPNTKNLIYAASHLF